MGESHVKRLEEDLKVLQRQLFAQGDTGVFTQMSLLSLLASGKGGGDIMLEDGKSKAQEIIESNDPALMKGELVMLKRRSAMPNMIIITTCYLRCFISREIFKCSTISDP